MDSLPQPTNQPSPPNSRTLENTRETVDLLTRIWNIGSDIYNSLLPGDDKNESARQWLERVAGLLGDATNEIAQAGACSIKRLGEVENCLDMIDTEISGSKYVDRLEQFRSRLNEVHGLMQQGPQLSPESKNALATTLERHGGYFTMAAKRD